MTVALCMFALWAWGGWISWKGIENGNGWIGAILSEKIRKSLNKKENWWKKAAQQQKELGLPVTADKNWVVVTPDEIQ